MVEEHRYFPGRDRGASSLPWLSLRGLDSAIDAGVVATTDQLRESIHFYAPETRGSYDAIIEKAWLFSLGTASAQGKLLARELCQELDPVGIHTIARLEADIFGSKPSEISTADRCGQILGHYQREKLERIAVLCGELLDTTVKAAWDTGELKDAADLERMLVSPVRDANFKYLKSSEVVRFYLRFSTCDEVKLMAAQLHHSNTEEALADFSFSSANKPGESSAVSSQSGISEVFSRLGERLIRGVGKLFSDALNNEL